METNEYYNTNIVYYVKFRYDGSVTPVFNHLEALNEVKKIYPGAFIRLCAKGNTAYAFYTNFHKQEVVVAETLYDKNKPSFHF